MNAHDLTEAQMARLRLAVARLARSKGRDEGMAQEGATVAFRVMHGLEDKTLREWGINREDQIARILLAGW